MEDGVLKFNLLCSSFLNLNGELGEAFVSAKFEELVQIFKMEITEQLENSKAAYDLAFTSAGLGCLYQLFTTRTTFVDDEKGGYFAQRFVTGFPNGDTVYV